MEVLLLNRHKKKKRIILYSALALVGIGLLSGISPTNNIASPQTVYADEYNVNSETADDSIAKALQENISGDNRKNTDDEKSTGQTLNAYQGTKTLDGDIDNPSLLPSYFFTTGQNPDGAIDKNSIPLKDLVRYTESNLNVDSNNDTNTGGGTYGNLGTPKGNSGNASSYQLANDIQALYELNFVSPKKPDGLIMGTIKWLFKSVEKTFTMQTFSLNMGKFGATLFDFSNSIISAIGYALDNLNPVRWFDETQKSLTNGKGFVNKIIDASASSIGVNPEFLMGIGRIVFIFIVGIGVIRMMWSVRNHDFRNFLTNNKSFLFRIITIFGLLPVAIGVSNTIDSWFKGVQNSYNSVSFFSDKITLNTTKFATTLNLNMSPLRKGDTSSRLLDAKELKNAYSIDEDSIQKLNQEINYRWNLLQGNSSDKKARNTNASKATEIFDELLNPNYVTVDAYSNAIRNSKTDDIAPSKMEVGLIGDTKVNMASRGFTAGSRDGTVELPDRMSQNGNGNFLFVDNTGLQSIIQKVKANLSLFGLTEEKADEETIATLISGNILYNNIANKNYVYVNQLFSGGDLTTEGVDAVGGKLNDLLKGMIEGDNGKQAGKLFSTNSSRIGVINYHGSGTGIGVYSNSSNAMTPRKISWDRPASYLYGVSNQKGYSNANNYTFANLSNSDLIINYISGELLNFGFTTIDNDELKNVVSKSGDELIPSDNSSSGDKGTKGKGKNFEAESKFAYYMLANARDIAIRNKYQGITNLSGTRGYSFSNQGVVILLQSYLQDGTLNFNGVQTTPDASASKKHTARDGVSYANTTIPNVGLGDLANRTYYFGSTWLTVGVISLIVLGTFFKLPFFTAMGKVVTHFARGQFLGDMASGLIFLAYFIVLKSSQFFAYLTINFATLASSAVLTWIKNLINILGNIETGSFLGNVALWGAKTILGGFANNSFIMALIILYVMSYPVMNTQFGKKQVKIPLASIILVMPHIMVMALEESIYSLRVKVYGSRAGVSFFDRVKQRARVKSASDIKDEIVDDAKRVGKGIKDTAMVAGGVALMATGAGAGIGANLAAQGAGGLLGGGVGADGLPLPTGEIDNTNLNGFGNMVQTFAKPALTHAVEDSEELGVFGQTPSDEELREYTEDEAREMELNKELDRLNDNMDDPQVIEGKSLSTGAPVVDEDDNVGFVKPVEPIEAEIINPEDMNLEGATLDLPQQPEFDTAVAGAFRKASEEFEDVGVDINNSENPIPEDDSIENRVRNQYRIPEEGDKPKFGDVDIEADNATVEGNNFTASRMSADAVEAKELGSEGTYSKPEQGSVNDDKQDKTTKPLTREEIRDRDKESLGKLGKLVAEHSDSKYQQKLDAKIAKEQEKSLDPKNMASENYKAYKKAIREEYKRVMSDPNASKEEKKRITQEYVTFQQKGIQEAKKDGVHWTNKPVDTAKAVGKSVDEALTSAEARLQKAKQVTLDPKTYINIGNAVSDGMKQGAQSTAKAVKEGVDNVKSGYAKDKFIVNMQEAGHKVKDVAQNVTKKTTEKVTEKIVEVRKDLTDPTKFAQRKADVREFWKKPVYQGGNRPSNSNSKSGETISSSNTNFSNYDSRRQEELDLRRDMQMRELIDALNRNSNSKK